MKEREREREICLSDNIRFIIFVFFPSSHTSPAISHTQISYYDTPPPSLLQARAQLRHKISRERSSGDRYRFSYRKYIGVNLNDNEISLALKKSREISAVGRFVVQRASESEGSRERSVCVRVNRGEGRRERRSFFFHEGKEVGKGRGEKVW